MHRLLIYDNQGNLASNLVLARDPITIGRDPTCELPLSDINISRKHAKIEPMGRFYVVNDLKSTNGTWVNQSPIRMHLLRHGDVVRIGNFRLVMQVVDEPSSAGGDFDPDEGCHTKIIEDPFSYDKSPDSPHTLRINVGKEKAQFPADKEPRERLLKLHEISCKLGIIETPTVLCGQAVEVVLEQLKADRASLLIPKGKDLATVAARVAPSQKGQPFNIHYGVLRSAVDELSAILTEDAAQDRRFRSDTERPGSRVRSVMCVPLVAQTNLQGVLYLDRTTNPDPFTEDDLRFLAVIGNQVAINLANARLFEEVLIEKQKVQAVISSLKDGLVITDKELVVQSSNAAASQIFNPDATSGIEGRNLMDLLLDRDYSLDESELRAAIRDAKEFRLLIQRSSEVRAYAASIATIATGEEGQSGYVFSFRDTTDLLHLQELKSEFIRNASHKLRTPLTVILGSLDLLRSLPADGELGANRGVLIAGMEKNLQHLQGLVSRFLEFAELDRNRFKLRDLDLREVLSIAANGVAEIATEKEIEIVNRIPRSELLGVLGDSDRLVQCFHNILENSVKFAPHRSTVRVRSEVGEEWIRLHIEDEGPGIPSEDLLDIFSGFHQVEKIPTGEVPGAGLGLTIAKRIIHAHHGNITALSPVPETGKGTVITISLPRPGVKEPRPSFQPEAMTSS